MNKPRSLQTFLLLSLIWLLGCAGDAKLDAETDFKVAVDTSNSEISAAATVVLDSIIAVVDKSAKVKDEKLESLETPATEAQLDKSVMAKVACCESVNPVQDCCCAEILERYEGHLRSKQYDALEKLVLEEVFYAACADQQQDFENKIEALEIAYEE